MYRWEYRIRGALYGYFVGNAMGVSTAFLHKEEIAEQYGVLRDIVGGGFMRVQPGHVSTDAELVLQMMNVVMSARSGDDIEKDMCISGLSALFVDSGIERTCSGLDNNALGSEGLARALPFALMGPEFADCNVTQVNMTHHNLTCSAVTLDYHRMLCAFIQGIPYLQTECLYNTILEPFGYIKNVYSNAVYWATLDTFEDAVVAAVNHGGEADTIAAITGSIAGAKHGFYAIPANWVNLLDKSVKEILEKFIYFVKTYCNP